MKIILNGSEKEFQTSGNLQEIIQLYCKQTKNIIAEVNGEIIRGADWVNIKVNDGDAIELVSFVGGG